MKIDKVQEAPAVRLKQPTVAVGATHFAAIVWCIRMLAILYSFCFFFFFFSSRRRHTRLQGDWSSDVCSSDLIGLLTGLLAKVVEFSGVEIGRRHRMRDGARLPHPHKQIGRASCRERV